MGARLKLAVWKFASCDGCQLSLLNLEDQLLALTDYLNVAYFLEASSAVAPGPYDLSLVEGSITTPADAKRIRQIRRVSKAVAAIGACATAGGIQALRNFADINTYIPIVYAQPGYIRTLADSTPLAQHIKIDLELPGCPINKYQLLEVIKALIQGRRPRFPQESVCSTCKRLGIICVMVAEGQPCLGPVTQAGCGALCPASHRGCYGCFGPKENPNTASLAARFRQLGVAEADIVRLFRTFTAAAAPFRQESLAHETNH